MAQTFLLIFITLINLVLWCVFFVRLKKKFASQALLTDIKNEVNKLLIEINRTVDQDITLIENRIQDLKALIQAADRRLNFVQKEEQERLRENAVLTKLSSKPAPNSQIKTAAQRYQNMKRSSASDDVQLSINFDSYKNIEEPEIISAPAHAEAPLKDKVITLYSEGMSIDDISKKLKLSITEVQFIIDLFSR
ncbi:hypothetical protein H0R92_01090 [Treponema sp. OMZ 840]|uniref:DUF6115 domain-containing protein n=1 Tax=Treponema sp. OMZ 840 TaxID=244313 RepID=UPI003D8DCB1F